uniref:Uncharacterized protein n=1 Tax=Solibacter usitatus (strain Ellin6076) TaxID=234267 RepID=Q01XH3_SOLUE
MLEYANHQDIRQRLWDELETARAEHVAASRQFDLTVHESPSGLPHPDGVLRMQQVGRNAGSALQDYMRALKRFTDFTLNGTIPPDLLPPAP